MPAKHHTVVGAILAIALTAQPEAHAQENPAPAVSPDTIRKSARAVRIAPRSIRVDGRLDEATWNDAPPITDFVQRQPQEGAAPRERTEVRFAYDDEALYVGARMYADDPSLIQAPVGRRDNIGQMEYLLVSLDTYLDRRTAYTFGVSASGVRADRYHPRDRETGTDATFNPVWEARARIDSVGWTAEMRIPFSQLRFNAAEQLVFGLNVDRWIPSRNEQLFWVLIPQNVAAWSSRMGNLVGIEGVRPSRRVELLPYVASNATLRGDVPAGHPFVSSRDLGTRVGGDVKVGIGPNLTLEATVNPDFGQVEADPAQVNLSAFEIFFSEQRPFFVEGASLLRGNGPSYFYSRRIGGLPSYGVMDRVMGPREYEDLPSQSTILGSAKLTGRLASGTSLGALVAVNDRERARVADATGTTLGRFVVAPRTSMGVLRTQQEFGRAGSSVGLSLTGAHRAMNEGSQLDSLLHRDAVAGGADWTLRLRDGEYEVRGWLGGSYVQGSAPALALTQLSSARYMQRPDASHVTYDPTRTSLAGYSALLLAERVSGRHWLWSVVGRADSPEFEINDAGRIGQVDNVIGNASLTYRETRPGSRFRSYSIEGALENMWNFGGVRGFSAVRTDMSATFHNFWILSYTGWVDLRAQSSTLTRGGPYAGTGQAWANILLLESSAASRTRWNARVYYGESELGERTYRFSGGFSQRPRPAWQYSITPNYLRLIDPRQYIASRPGGTAATFDRRYIFAFADRNEFRLSMRLNYALTPDLTLETYAEPFVSSARFHGFGELAAARSRQLRRYGEDGTTIDREGNTYTVTDERRPSPSDQAQPHEFTFSRSDFKLLSFRSNAVLRWEWRPGSTLFVVWQQNREDFVFTRNLVQGRDLLDGFSAPGDNFLAVKASFWLPLR